MTKYFAVPYRVRRIWLALIGGTCLLILLGSLIGDIFFDADTAEDVYLPITGLLGGSFLGYVWSRREDTKEGRTEGGTSIKQPGDDNLG